MYVQFIVVAYEGTTYVRIMYFHTLRTGSVTAVPGMVHAYVGQNVLKCYIRLNFRNFFMSGFVFLTLFLVDATDFRNQSPKRSQLS